MRSLSDLDGMVCVGKNATRLIEKEEARLRECGLLRRASEEGNANLIFQIG
jgi:hypothetical protein